MNSLKASLSDSLSRAYRRLRNKFKAKKKFRTVRPNVAVSVSPQSVDHPNFDYPNNQITTSKYTWLNFWYKNLYEQMYRSANIYFLTIQFINWLPGMDVFVKEVQLLPFIFVLGVTLIKDLYEDFGRHKSDRRVNNEKCRRYDKEQNRFVQITWRQIRVGDIIHLSCDEAVPADILVLRANQDEDDFGTCYVETANLDGESNLKQRFAVRNFCDRHQAISDIDFDFVVNCDQPNNTLIKFHGMITYGGDGDREGAKRTMTNRDNLLLRNCVLKNTSFVEGLVLYTGHDTKAMLNNKVPPMKQSRLERMMNSDIIWCIIILIVLCSTSALSRKAWLDQFDQPLNLPFYIPDKDLPTIVTEARFLWDILGFIILYQMMIPISLYVCIEIIKMWQVYFIHHDEGFSGTCKGKRVKCRALNITEDLGQVEYMFCDKTGTLTENAMEFRCCTIKGVDYAHLPKEDKSFESQGTEKSNRSKSFKLNAQLKRKLDSISDQYTKLMRSEIALFKIDESPTKSGDNLANLRLTEEEEMIRDFFVLLAICNTAMAADMNTHKDTMNAEGDSQTRVSERSDKATPDTNSNNAQSRKPKPIYESESPDEVALVTAACKYRVVLLKRTKDMVKVMMPNGTTVNYTVLILLPFDSNRKRMSIIVRCPLSNRIVLLCKGSDMTVLSKLASLSDATKQKEKEQTNTNMTNYSIKGYRILCMARRYLTEEQYNQWFHDYQKAEMDQTNRDRLVAESFDSIEDELELIGATAIEDRLQPRVPEVIANLKAAGIVIWVLTGDKMETAVNIANSCRLFNSGMRLIELTMANVTSKGTARDILLKKIAEVRRSFPLNESHVLLEKDSRSWLHQKLRTLYDVLYWDRQIQFVDESKRANWGLVIDGPSLNYVLHKHNSNLFIELTQYCSSVLCCRSTPIQKAVVVTCVKNKLSALTMAVGDGANDVVMIQTANVGVGISGVEGTQAVMASDFAVPKFHHLERLILVHGNLCYNRLALTVLYFFYKNTISILIIFMFQFACGFSGQSPLDDIYLMLVNIFFTTLPPVVRGVFEKDCDEELFLRYPALYERGRNSRVYTNFSFWVNTADSIYQSLVIYGVTYGFYCHTGIDVYEFGLILFSMIIMTNLVQIALETKYWPPCYLWSFFLSLLFYFSTVMMLDFIKSGPVGGQNYKLFYNIAQDPKFWLLFLIVPFVCLMPRCALRTIQEMVKPQFSVPATVQKNFN